MATPIESPIEAEPFDIERWRGSRQAASAPLTPPSLYRPDVRGVSYGAERWDGMLLLELADGSTALARPSAPRALRTERGTMFMQAYDGSVVPVGSAEITLDTSQPIELSGGTPSDPRVGQQRRIGFVDPATMQPLDEIDPLDVEAAHTVEEIAATIRARSTQLAAAVAANMPAVERPRDANGRWMRGRAAPTAGDVLSPHVLQHEIVMTEEQVEEFRRLWTEQMQSSAPMPIVGVDSISATVTSAADAEAAAASSIALIESQLHSLRAVDPRNPQLATDDRRVMPTHMWIYDTRAGITLCSRCGTRRSDDAAIRTSCSGFSRAIDVLTARTLAAVAGVQLPHAAATPVPRPPATVPEPTPHRSRRIRL